MNFMSFRLIINLSSIIISKYSPFRITKFFQLNIWCSFCKWNHFTHYRIIFFVRLSMKSKLITLYTIIKTWLISILEPGSSVMKNCRFFPLSTFHRISGNCHRWWVENTPSTWG